MALDIPGYRLSHQLGSGGHGSVFLAVQLSLGRQVALKVVTDEDAGGPAGRARLEREARTLAALDHPNVVRVHDHGSFDGISYLAMEYLEGPDLHGRLVELSQGGASAETVPLPGGGAAAAAPVTVAAAPAGPTSGARATSRLQHEAPVAFRRTGHHQWVVGVGMQVARALTALHGAGLVHRDVKPANILFRKDGTAVLSDFGLALSAASTRVTMTGEVLGTVPFMSPEQARGEPLSPRSDIYSLGATLYECLSGAVPFAGLSAARVLQRLGRSAPRPLRRLNPLIPIPLARVVSRAMARDPKDRHASAEELLADLERVVHGERIGRRITRSTIRRSLVGAVALACLSAAFVMLDPLAIRNESRLRRELRLAAEQHRALIEVAPSIHYLVKVVPSDAEFGGEGPGPLAGFQDARETLLLPQPATYVRVYFVAKDRSRWWAGDDPLAYVRLLRLDPVDGTSLTPHVKLTPDVELPTMPHSSHFRPAPKRREPWVGYAAATYPLAQADSVDDSVTTSPFELRAPFTAAATECPNTAIDQYAFWLMGRRDRRSVFAHPDEPREVAEWLDTHARTLGARDSPSDHPTSTTFWLAVRIAGFLGGRLPRSVEWMLAAQDGKGHLRPGGRSASDFSGRCVKHSQENIRPVTADLGPDVTERGVSGIAGNAREWTLTGQDSQGAPTRYAPVGIEPSFLARGSYPSGRPSEPLLCITFMDLLGVDIPQGMRVFRDLITTN